MKANAATTAFIRDLKVLLEKHDVEMKPFDEYNGAEEYVGTSLIISSKTDVSGDQLIYIDDAHELVDLIKQST